MVTLPAVLRCLSVRCSYVMGHGGVLSCWTSSKLTQQARLRMQECDMHSEAMQVLLTTPSWHAYTMLVNTVPAKVNEVHRWDG